MTGENRYKCTDLKSGGYGGWGLTREFITEANNQKGYLGPCWGATQLPFLRSYAGNILAITGARHKRSFTDNFNGTYTAHYFYGEKLTSNSIAQELTLTDTLGNQTVYHDFSVTGKEGFLKRFVDADGNTTSVTYSGNLPSTVTRTTTVGANTYLETWTFTYDASNRWSSVKLSQTLNGGTASNVRQVNYSYYADGSLQRAVIKDSDLSTTIETKYYRYYAQDPFTLFTGLKFAVNGKAYERLKNAAGGTDAGVDAATDATVSTYADLYFEYDGFTRVTKEVVQGQGCG
jgi:hypothetical protein